MLILLPFLVAHAFGRDYYTYTAPDGTVVLTDSPDHDGFEKWWSDVVSGSYLPNGVPMPRLDRITNLDGYDGWFLDAADREGVPAELLKAVAVAESRMNPGAVSSAGAKGLMQLMPGTATEMQCADPFDPRENIIAGTKLLRLLSNRYNGDINLVLAAYNAGPGNVAKVGGIPFEQTRVYVENVYAAYQRFLAAERQPYSSPESAWIGNASAS